MTDSPDERHPISLGQARIRAIDSVALARLVRLRDELARDGEERNGKVVMALDVLIEALRSSDPLSDQGRELRLALAAGSSQSLLLAEIETALGQLQTFDP